MPTLKYYVSEGSPKIYSVHKPVTIGIPRDDDRNKGVGPVDLFF